MLVETCKTRDLQDVPHWKEPRSRALRTAPSWQPDVTVVPLVLGASSLPVETRGKEAVAAGSGLEMPAGVKSGLMAPDGSRREARG